MVQKMRAVSSKDAGTVAGHTKLAIAQLSVKYAISVVNLIISQPFVEVARNEQMHLRKSKR